MTQTVTCHTCRASVPRNEATLRSVGLRDVLAWCRTCKPLTIPAQRTAPALESDGTR